MVGVPCRIAHKELSGRAVVMTGGGAIRSEARPRPA